MRRAGAPCAGDETSAACASCFRSRPASRTRSTCSDRQPRRATKQALPIVLDDPHVDAVLVLFVPAGQRHRRRGRGRRRRSAARGRLQEARARGRHELGGVPEALRSGSAAAAFAYPESAARALGRVAERAEWLRRPLGSVPSLDGIDRAAAARVVERALARAEDSWLDPAETRELLAPTGCRSFPTARRDASRRSRGR